MHWHPVQGKCCALGHHGNQKARKLALRVLGLETIFIETTSWLFDQISLEHWVR